VYKFIFIFFTRSLSIPFRLSPSAITNPYFSNKHLRNPYDYDDLDNLHSFREEMSRLREKYIKTGDDSILDDYYERNFGKRYINIYDRCIFIFILFIYFYFNYYLLIIYPCLQLFHYCYLSFRPPFQVLRPWRY
jgi:hypothetical protein